MAAFFNLVVVVAVELYPFARWPSGGGLADQLLNLTNGFDPRVGQVDDAMIQQAVHPIMQVCVDEAGHYGSSNGVDELGILPGQGQNVLVFSHSKDMLSLNGHCFLNGVLGVHCQNTAMMQNDICRFPLVSQSLHLTIHFWVLGCPRSTQNRHRSGLPESGPGLADRGRSLGIESFKECSEELSSYCS